MPKVKSTTCNQPFEALSTSKPHNVDCELLTQFGKGIVGGSRTKNEEEAGTSYSTLRPDGELILLKKATKILYRHL